MDTLIKRIQLVHKDCHKLRMIALGKYLDVAGNIGIFSQNENEYIKFFALKNLLTKPSNNLNQKYYELIDPILIDVEGLIPKATYTHLYIRKPDYTLYGKYLGDVDFVMSEENYEQFKADVLAGRCSKGVEIYSRPNWDTVQNTNPDVTSVAYISTKDFSEKVRVKFD